MPVLEKGAANPTTALNIFVRDAEGNLADADVVKFKVFSVAADGTRAQVFPGSGFHTVPAAGRFDVGSYYAYDTTAGWAPSGSTGLYEILWEVTIGGVVAGTSRERFEVLGVGTAFARPQGYLYLADARAQGAPVSVSDERLCQILVQVEQEVARYTRNLFGRHRRRLRFDGGNSRRLFLPYALIAVKGVTINDTDVLDAEDYVVHYDFSEGPGGQRRWNPQVELRDFPRSVFSGSSGQFLHARKQYVDGVFGFVEEDGGVPRALAFAGLQLAMVQMANQGPRFFRSGEGAPLGELEEEQVDDHRIRYGSSSSSSGGGTPLVFPKEIQTTFDMYRGPVAIGSPERVMAFEVFDVFEGV